MHTFPYDPFQQEAVHAIRQGISVFVSAPTGSGKTVIAEVAVEEALKSQGQAIYTAPIKALSNQKFRDFHARYGEKVGILTGDLNLNPEAPLLIMTTEIYRNCLFENPERFARCRWVIFDEVHYLDDPERGTVWEEALLLTPRQTEILALSATIPNAKELAGWIERIHGRPVQVVHDTQRPVPLKFTYQCQDELITSLPALKTNGYHNQTHWKPKPRHFHHHRGKRHRKSARSTRHAPGSERPFGKPNRADHLLRRIQSAGRLPCLYFSFGRKRTEELAWEFAGLGLVQEAQRTELLNRFDALCKRYELAQERSACEMRELVAQGVAFHHAGLLPTLKEVVEVLFTSRLIQAIVTTETFALGVNMPARSVVLDTLTKRSPSFKSGRFSRQSLTVRQCHQMSGRAGRRGMDEAGFVYLRVNPWEIPFSDVEKLTHGRPEQVFSRFNLAYATLLNLYQSHGEEMLPFYQQTFHAHQASQAQQRETFSLLERKLGLLKELGYLAGAKESSHGGKRGQLTHKGIFATEFYGYELILAELFDAGWLEELRVVDLGIFLLSVVYEPRRGIGPEPKLPRRIRSWSDALSELLEEIHKKERRYRIAPLTKKPAFHLAGTMERWVAGAAFDKVVTQSGVDEGELIRYLRMTIQLARAITLNPEASPALKDTSRELLRKINRDAVDAEAELRRSL